MWDSAHSELEPRWNCKSHFTEILAGLLWKFYSSPFQSAPVISEPMLPVTSDQLHLISWPLVMILCQVNNLSLGKGNPDFYLPQRCEKREQICRSSEDAPQTNSYLPIHSRCLQIYLYPSVKGSEPTAVSSPRRCTRRHWLVPLSYVLKVLATSDPSLRSWVRECLCRN